MNVNFTELDSGFTEIRMGYFDGQQFSKVLAQGFSHHHLSESRGSHLDAKQVFQSLNRRPYNRDQGEDCYFASRQPREARKLQLESRHM